MKLEQQSDDWSRSMADAGVRERRRQMLNVPHVAALTAYAAKLRERIHIEMPDARVPDFDPLDGGVKAKMLFLFQKPGKRAAAPSEGSGFVSRHNNDDTAQAVFEVMRQAGIPRTSTILWNVVPWWNKEPKISADELRKGIRCLNDLIQLLSPSIVVVMVGAEAKEAFRDLEPQIEKNNLFESRIPVRIKKHDSEWNEVVEKWKRAATAALGSQFTPETTS